MRTTLMMRTTLRATAVSCTTRRDDGFVPILALAGRRGVQRALRRGLVIAWLLLACGLLGACSPPRKVLEAPAAAEAERLVIDTRLPGPFAAGHAPGALNLQWDWKQLAARVEAYVPKRSTPLALRATDADEAELAAGLLARLGYTDVAAASPDAEAATLPTMTAAELRARLEAGEELVVLDVREPWEHALGTIDGAARLDPDGAPARLGELEPGVHYAVICEAGYRSGQLASWMQRHGLRATNVLDGMAGWRALPDVR